MEIFDRLKGTPQKVNSDSSKSKEGVRKNSAIAVGYAKSFEKEFDYSENSINDLEEILDYYSKNAAQSKLTEIQIWSMAPILALIWKRSCWKTAFPQRTMTGKR